MYIPSIRDSRNLVVFLLLVQREESLQMEVSFVNIKVPYKWVISILFAELVLCLLFLKNNQFKIIFIRRRHIWGPN